MKIHDLSQALTGNELVTIQQQQSGQMAECSMPLSKLLAYINANEPDVWLAILPTVLPEKPGVPWNNSGLISIS